MLFGCGSVVVIFDQGLRRYEQQAFSTMLSFFLPGAMDYEIPLNQEEESGFTQM